MLTKYNIRVSDYIVSLLASQGIGHVYMVTGGAAMYLNDAFGRESRPKKAFVKGNSPARCRRKPTLNSTVDSNGTI